MKNNQEVKSDFGKPQLRLVPTEIIRNIARLEEYEKRVESEEAPIFIKVTQRKNKKWFAIFKCQKCGKSFETQINNVLSGNTKSCGCTKGTYHGESKTRLYRMYAHILERCNNKKCKEYKWYGARGIECKFKDYIEFRDFAIQNGYNDTLTVERIDVNGHYEPQNITFIPLKLQARNTRQNVKITYKGLTLCASEWAEILECNADTLTKRKRSGWSDEKTLETLIKGNEKMIDISLVPTEIIEAIKQVRIYGCQKYHDPENWKRVELERYQDAMYRHLLAYIDNPNGLDEESGLPHLWHLACNVAFICELQKEDWGK